jgi:hypothetical protein
MASETLPPLMTGPPADRAERHWSADWEYHPNHMGMRPS